MVGFDGDCTLYDTQASLVSNTYETYRIAGHYIGRVAIFSCFEQGHNPRQIFNKLTPDLDADVLEELFYEIDEASGSGQINPYPGVKECLNELVESGHQLGIVTSRTHDSTLRLLDALGLLDFFATGGEDRIIGSDNVSRLKPNPEGINLLLEKTGAMPSDAFFIGDTPSDMLAAGNAGVTPVGFTQGFGSPLRLRAAGAAYLFDDHTQLPKIVGH